MCFFVLGYLRNPRLTISILIAVREFYSATVLKIACLTDGLINDAPRQSRHHEMVLLKHMQFTTSNLCVRDRKFVFNVLCPHCFVLLNLNHSGLGIYASQIRSEIVAKLNP